MPYTRRVSEKAQSTKKRIFDAGIRLFGENGFYATTVEEIAVAAGVSIGSFYYHFKSKEDLFMDWANSLDAEYLAFYQQQRDRLNSGNAISLLRELLLFTVERWTKFGKEFNLLLYLRMQQDLDFYNRMTSYDRIYGQILRTLISEGQEDGCIRRDISVEQMEQNLHKMNRGLLVDWSISHRKQDVVEISTSLIDLVLQGMEAKS